MALDYPVHQFNEVIRGYIQRGLGAFEQCFHEEKSQLSGRSLMSATMIRVDRCGRAPSGRFCRGELLKFMGVCYDPLAQNQPEKLEHRSTGPSSFSRYLFALLVLQGVVDTNLTIEVLTSFNVDLCLLRFAGCQLA